MWQSSELDSGIKVKLVCQYSSLSFTTMSSLRKNFIICQILLYPFNALPVEITYESITYEKSVSILYKYIYIIFS